jgi:hypothetical protein
MLLFSDSSRQHPLTAIMNHDELGNRADLLPLYVQAFLSSARLRAAISSSARRFASIRT